MRLSNQTLKLLVNPFSAPLDANGRACALVPTDPSEPSGSKFVGARLRVDPKTDVVKRPGNAFGNRAKPRVEYDLKPRSFADTGYYREKLKSGEVFSEEGANEKIVAAGRAALAESGLDAEKVFTAWKSQGLGDVVEQVRAQSAAAAQKRARIKAIRSNDAGESRSKGAVS